MKLLLNTNLIPIFSGTYENMWEVREYADSGDELTPDYKQKDLLKSIAGIYQGNEEGIRKILGVPFIKKIHFTRKTWSPREYNCNTDQLDFVVTIDKREMVKTLKKLAGNKKFDGWLNANFSSYDGFISFTPNNYRELSEEILGNGREYYQAISALIRFLAKTEYREIEQDMYGEWASNGYNGLKYTISSED